MQPTPLVYQQRTRGTRSRVRRDGRVAAVQTCGPCPNVRAEALSSGGVGSGLRQAEKYHDVCGKHGKSSEELHTLGGKEKRFDGENEIKNLKTASSASGDAAGTERAPRKA